MSSTDNKSQNISIGDSIIRPPSKIKRFFLYLRSFGPLFLSHHPECERFKEHTINIGRIKLCIGCFVGYPTAILGIYMLSFLNYIQDVSPHFLILLSITFLLTFFL